MGEGGPGSGDREVSSWQSAAGGSHIFPLKDLDLVLLKEGSCFWGHLCGTQKLQSRNQILEAF